MKTNYFSNQRQSGTRSILHPGLQARLAGVIAIFLVFLAMLVGAGSPVGALDALPVGLAELSNPILPLGDPIIVEDNTGGEAVMGKPSVAGDGSKFLVVWRAPGWDRHSGITRNIRFSGGRVRRDQLRGFLLACAFR